MQLLHDLGQLVVFILQNEAAVIHVNQCQSL